MASDRVGDILADELYDEGDEDVQEDRYLTFELGEAAYAIDICHVVEIVGLQKITAVPDMPAFVKGVVNLRGQVVPVMDVRLRFHMTARDYDERTCVVVVDIKDTVVGLIVDTVRDVCEIPEADVCPPPAINKGASVRYIRGMGKVGADVKILLDVDRLLFEEELEEIAGLA